MDTRSDRRHRSSRLSPGLIRAISAVVVLLAVALATSGCSVSRTFRDDTYTVQRGDTLSQIAYEYGIDWQELARWNRIGPPYDLRVGQTIYLKPFPPIDYARFNPPGATTPRPASPGSQPASAARRGHTRALGQQSAPTVTSGPVVRTSDQGAVNPSPAKPAPEPLQTAPVTAKTSTPSPVAGPTIDTGDEAARITAASKHSDAKQAAVSAGGPDEDGWQWPATGALLRGYDPEDRHRGIEIGGQVGAPIYAASSGTVVYNGTGLKGYGRLIIIKHDEHYLSAYGFVDKSHVSQGQSVAAGAHIADMGRGPGNRAMLHFEIRRDGDPVDPETLLPSH